MTYEVRWKANGRPDWLIDETFDEDDLDRAKAYIADERSRVAPDRFDLKFQLVEVRDMEGQ